MKEKKYRYGNLPIPGGGYVTGFLFHPKKEKVLYLRTDIGGSYRFDYDSQTWYSLSEKVNMFDLVQGKRKYITAFDYTSIFRQSIKSNSNFLGILLNL